MGQTRIKNPDTISALCHDGNHERCTEILVNGVRGTGGKFRIVRVACQCECHVIAQCEWVRGKFGRCPNGATITLSDQQGDNLIHVCDEHEPIACCNLSQ